MCESKTEGEGEHAGERTAWGQISHKKDIKDNAEREQNLTKKETNGKKMSKKGMKEKMED